MRIPLRAAILVILTGLLTLPSPAVSAGAPGATEVAGRKIPPLLGEPVASIRLYAFHDGAPAPIPFQIDPRAEHGKWVLAHGRSRRQDDDPGTFDGTDALVFRNADLGERGDVRSLPPGAQRWVELRLGEAATPLGFLYAGTFATPPPRSERDDVRYDPGKDRIVTDVYEATFGAPLPTSLLLDGKEENVLRGVRASGEARFFGGLFTLRRDEKSIHADVEGWIDGPVRVVRPGRYEISLPLGFRATARVNLLFYRDHVVGHAVARIKIPPRLVPADGELTAFFAFRDQTGARLLLAGKEPIGPVDGTPAPAKRALAGKKARWAGLLLPDGRTFLLAVRAEGSLASLEQRLYFEERSAMPAFGFELGGVNRLETGEHDLYVSVSLLDTHDPAAVTRAAEILRDPPAVHAAEVLSPPPPAPSPPADDS